MAIVAGCKDGYYSSYYDSFDIGVYQSVPGRLYLCTSKNVIQKM